MRAHTHPLSTPLVPSTLDELAMIALDPYHHTARPPPSAPRRRLPQRKYMLTVPDGASTLDTLRAYVTDTAQGHPRERVGGTTGCSCPE